jgi:hypothetical protein
MRFTILLIRIGLLLAAIVFLAVSDTQAQALFPADLADRTFGTTLEGMKTDVYRYGTGKQSKVVLTMRDGTVRKGHIRETADDTFQLTDSKTQKTSTIAYADVGGSRKPGRSLVGKLAVRIAVFIALTAVVLYEVIGNAGGFEQ